MEGKYGGSLKSRPFQNGMGSEKINGDSIESSTDSEEEDDEGILASEALDAQIQKTLDAIRRKDPRVYDEKAKFYTDPDEGLDNGDQPNTEKEKPMYLSDYHRKNLLEGDGAALEMNDEPMTYAQQQENLKNVVVKEMHAKANVVDEDNSEGSDDEFLVRKTSTSQCGGQETRPQRRQPALDVESANKDPENYLSQFMEARAWVPTDNSRLQPFESDDEDEERRAELFEEAYNLRFEDPKASNEKLLSHARDAAAKYSVRKEATNPRKKARESERAKKDATRQAREEDKARFRKLKVAEAEEKIKKIQEAAGLRHKPLQGEDWSTLIEEGWDDVRWEEEMKNRFGDEYYEDYEPDADNDEEGTGKRKAKKPKWEEDIDIGDLVPGSELETAQKPQYSLTDEDSEMGGPPIPGSEINVLNEGDHAAKRKSSGKKEKDERKKADRERRRKIESVVDQQIGVDDALANFSKKHTGHFRYRETSPTTYGLTAHDILMASDSQLNQYAGLKKMAPFRDPTKKKKDKKHLGKKARLRQWRKETFGDELGSQTTLGDLFAGANMSGNKKLDLKGDEIRDQKKGRRKKSGSTNKRAS